MLLLGVMHIQSSAYQQVLWAFHLTHSSCKKKKNPYYHIKDILLHRKEKSGFDDFTQAQPYWDSWADIINA